jgi:hypothetical protein
MARTTKPPRIDDTEAFTRHNIRVLRRQGYDDDYIAVSLKIRPAFMGGYGLKSRQVTVKKVEPSVIIDAIHQAIADSKDTPIHELLLSLGTNGDLVRTQRKHCPELDAAIRKLAQSNKRKRLGAIARRTDAEEKLSMAKAYAAGHRLIDNSTGIYVPLRELCDEMQRSFGWLHVRIHCQDERAIELHKRWMQHNNLVNPGHYDPSTAYAAGHQLLDNSVGKRVLLAELCAEMNRNENWLHSRAQYKDERAIELHKRWKQHNQNARKSKEL